MPCTCAISAETIHDIHRAQANNRVVELQLRICTTGVYLQTPCQNSPITQPIACRRFCYEGVWRIVRIFYRQIVEFVDSASVTSASRGHD